MKNDYVLPFLISIWFSARASLLTLFLHYPVFLYLNLFLPFPRTVPYTEEFIMELLRITTITPFGVVHAPVEDVEFHGYFIPKGTSVYSSIYSTHHDPEVFHDPHTLRPERFLGEDGKTVKKHDSLIPFSTGKRVCPGEGFARDQIFLFITSLVQRFSVVNETGKSKPTLIPAAGHVTLQPQNYSIILRDRF